MGDGLDKAAATTNVIPAETASAPYVTIDSPDWTGNAYVDHGAKCDPADPAHAQLWAHQVDSRCFLTAPVRQKLINTIHDRIGAVHKTYDNAILSLRMEELMRKDPTTSSLIYDVLLDAIGFLATAPIAKVVQRLGAGLTTHDVLDPQGATAEIAQSGPKTESVVRQVVTTAKRSLSRPSPVTDNPKKEANVGYLDSLLKGADYIYQQLRELGPAFAYDTELIVMYEAFDANLNTFEEYRQLLSDHLSRFENSLVSTIGVRKAEELESLSDSREQDYLDHRDHKYVGYYAGMDWSLRQDIKAFWVQAPAGRRLGLYERNHHTLPGAGDHCHDIVGMPSEVTADQAQQERASDEKRPYDFIEFVPEDFVAYAVEQHTRKWGTPPETRSPTFDEIAHWSDR